MAKISHAASLLTVFVQDRRRYKDPWNLLLHPSFYCLKNCQFSTFVQQTSKPDTHGRSQAKSRLELQCLS